MSSEHVGNHQPTVRIPDRNRGIGPTGAVAVQEVESIATDERTLARYLELQRVMLAANGNSLDIGPLIADAHRAPGSVLRNDVVRLTPSAFAAARMLAMNFANWRTRPAVADLAASDELDEIEQELTALSADEGSDAKITWELRELVIRASDATATGGACSTANPCGPSSQPAHGRRPEQAR